MSFLEQLKKPSVKPPIITLVGGAGVGKTTFAATFPKPIVIQGEDAETVFQTYAEEDQPMFFPRILAPTEKNHKVLDSVLGQMRALIKEDHDFKTLIVDSVTSLNIFFEQEIVYEDNETLAQRGKSLISNVADASGGFHKGYIILKNKHLEIMRAAQYLRDLKGMTIIFIAHNGIERIKNDPSESSEYHLYSLNMHKDSAKIYIDNSDAVLFLTHETIMRKDDKKARVQNTGTRTLIVSGDGKMGYPYAKNRYGLIDDLEVEAKQNPFIQHIPFFNK